MFRFRPKDSSDESFVAVRGHALAVSLLVMLFVVFIFIVISSAWFSISPNLRGSGMNATLFSGGQGFHLYQWVRTSASEGSWVEVDRIDFSQGVPNETRRYLVVGKNSDFSDILFHLTPDEGQAEFLDYVYLRRVSANAAGVTAGENGVVYDYGSDDPALLTYAGRASASTVPADGELSLACGGVVRAAVFDLYLSKDVCNHFSTWAFSGTMEVK